MDIEEVKCDVVYDFLQQSIPNDQIVVEFHPHLVNDGKKKTKAIINLLRQKGYKFFSVLDSYIEYSFLKVKV
tara:strand:+ start:1068 stop:1283 length:216 start_codon:yes stop_codon:yes gene_type:complete